MARGDKGTYNQQEQQAYSNANQQYQQGASNAAAAFAPAFGGYQNELANPGYTPAEQQQMTQAETGSLAGAFNAAASRERDQADRTGNTAGVNATNEQLAREQGQQQAQAMGSLAQAFGNARISGQENALRGLSGLYGQSESAADSGLSNQGRNVATEGDYVTQENKNNSSFWGKVLGAGLAAASFIPGVGPAVSGAMKAAGGVLGGGGGGKG